MTTASVTGRDDLPSRRGRIIGTAASIEIAPLVSRPNAVRRIHDATTSTGRSTTDRPATASGPSIERGIRPNCVATTAGRFPGHVAIRARRDDRFPLR